MMEKLVKISGIENASINPSNIVRPINIANTTHGSISGSGKRFLEIFKGL